MLPKLLPEAYPSIFEGCPSYFRRCPSSSEVQPKKRLSRDEKLKKIDSEVLDTFTKNDKILSFDHFLKEVVDRTVEFKASSNAIIHVMETDVHFLFLNFLPVAKLEKCVKIDKCMNLFVTVGGESFEASSLKQILNEPGKITFWSELINVLNYVKHITNMDASANREKCDLKRAIDTFLGDIVEWLKAWQNLKQKPRCGGLSEETFFAMIHTTTAIIEIIRHLLSCNAKYVLTAKFQTDHLEARFGLYRQMSGCCYHVSVQQLLESERTLRERSILKLHSENFGDISIKSLFSGRCFKNPIIPIVDYEALLLDIDVNDVDLPVHDIEVLTYIGGYCCHKLNILCSTCQEFFMSNKSLSVEINEDLPIPAEPQSEAYLCLLNREGLKMPSAKVVSALTYCLCIFQKLISSPYEMMFQKCNVKQQNVVVELTRVFFSRNDMFNSDEMCNFCKVPFLDGIMKIISCFSNICLNNYTKVLADKKCKASDERKLKKF